MRQLQADNKPVWVAWVLGRNLTPAFKIMTLLLIMKYINLVSAKSVPSLSKEIQVTHGVCCAGCSTNPAATSFLVSHKRIYMWTNSTLQSMIYLGKRAPVLVRGGSKEGKTGENGGDHVSCTISGVHRSHPKGRKKKQLFCVGQ